MKKRKFAWLLAASMTLTSFSGAALTGYAEEEPLILDEVEEEGAEAVDVSEGVGPEKVESEPELANAEEADDSFESEEQVEEAGTDVFIESVEAVDGIATQSAEASDEYQYRGFVINDKNETIDAKSGDRVLLSVDVETDGFRELEYQWYKCGEEDEKIAGATSAQYTTEPLGTDGSYRYECVVSDGYEEYYAYRTINTDYNIIIDKESDEVYAEPNRAVTLSVKVSTGKGKITYRWVKWEWNEDEYVEENVGTSPDLVVSNPQPGETHYKCYITNGYTQTEVYRSVICDNPDFIVEGGDTKYICPGESTELKIIASSENATLFYDWYWNKYDEEDDEYHIVPLGTEKAFG